MWVRASSTQSRLSRVSSAALVLFARFPRVLEGAVQTLHDVTWNGASSAFTVPRPRGSLVSP